MTKAAFPGTCSFCKGSYPKSAIGRHLAACDRRPAGKADGFDLVAEVPRSPYWLYIEAGAGRTLEDVDRFLRDTWLECCGHMSAFTIANQRYSSEPGEMDIRLEKIFQPGLACAYEYDFGSTTELTLRVISRGAGKGSVRLLARNDAPTEPCGTCGARGTELCPECGDSVLCKKCARNHDCGEEMLLPLVNSPRAGVCGYGT